MTIFNVDTEELNDTFNFKDVEKWDSLTHLTLISEFLSKEELENVVKSTMVGGATLTGLLGTSAWMAPGAAAASVAEAIIKDQKKMIPCSAALEGEYGMKDITIGVPCIIGKNGIEKILELNISEEERAKLHESEAAVRKTTAILKDLNVL